MIIAQVIVALNDLQMRLNGILNHLLRDILGLLEWQNVQKAATKALADINSSSTTSVQVRHVQGIKSGQNYLMDIELGAPASWTIEQTE